MNLIERNKQALAGRKSGDIIFFHPAGFNIFGSIILFVTNQYYHHGAIVIDENTLIEADPNAGVHYSSLESYLNSYYLDLFRLRDNRDGNGIVESAKKFIGWQYDFGNVFWAGIGIIWYRLTGLTLFRAISNPYDESKSVHSEEFISLTFKDVGVDLRPDLPASNVTAQNLADSEKLFKVSV